MMPSGEFITFAPGLRYALEVPSEVDNETPLAVSVHGVTRNAHEHYEAFVRLAQKARWLLLVPLFEADAYPDYQRLGRPGKGGRADLSLIELVLGLNSQLNLPDRPFYLFGHSGGAQFAHRFVMAHPERVARYAISAPGWYTFPDESLDYPYGLGSMPAQYGPLRPDDFLRVQGTVFVGSGDYRSGPNLRRNPIVDFRQGAHRVERAVRWTGAMNDKARQIGLTEPLRLRQLPNGGHSFSGLVRRNRLHEQAWESLTNPTETSS